jgi:hypothetical protein
LAATGNSNYGWFGGGSVAPPVPIQRSTVDRIDFSNDTGTANIRGPLSLARNSLAATGNSNYGWFGGGRGGSPVAARSVVDRIDFSNDSSTASPRGPLSSVRYSMGATGNSNYGWIGAGGPIPTPVATVNRIDFSNDSVSASIRGPLSAERSGLAATGNSNYGWFSSGFSLIVDRIDFSNDSSTATPRGPLSLVRYQASATGNSNYGWFGGGVIPTPAQTATVDRIDFSNDSVTASVKGSLSSPAGRSNLAATSNSTR